MHAKEGLMRNRNIDFQVTFVPDNFTRKPPKFERFIRPMGEDAIKTQAD